MPFCTLNAILYFKCMEWHFLSKNKSEKMKRSIISILVCFMFFVVGFAQKSYKLVWSDEFNQDGVLDSAIWNFEHGFARNEELQWYQPDNAYCKGGCLIIEARKEKRSNPMYQKEGNDWRTSREFIECTSSSVTTAGKKEFLYGRFEIRARIPVGKGAWPAIWLLGNSMEWPSCGEIDVMEFYRKQGVPHILANAAWGTNQRWGAKWNSKAIPFSHFLAKNPDWASEFHIWRMDWSREAIRLYLDDELLNEIFLKDTYNGVIGEKRNPFMQPQYLLLNLAVGGINGGEISENAFPMRYEIDYIRVYQQ